MELEKSWKALLQRINVKNTLNHSVTQKQFNHILQAPCVVATALTRFAPETLLKDEINIVIAGANGLECIAHGAIFHLLACVLPELESKTVNVILVGLDSHTINSKLNYKFTAAESINAKCENVYVHNIQASLNEFVQSENSADLVIINQPNLSIYHDEWLNEQSGIDKLLQRHIPIVFSSNGSHQLQFDKVFLESYNYDMINEYENPLRPTISSHQSWGKFLWQIKPRHAKRHPNLLQTLKKQQMLIDEANRYYGNLTDAAKSLLTQTQDGTKVQWVAPGCWFLPDSSELVDNPVNISKKESIESPEPYLYHCNPIYNAAFTSAQVYLNNHDLVQRFVHTHRTNNYQDETTN